MSREDFEALNEYTRDKFNADRRRFMEEAIIKDDGNWVKHTEHHWSRELNGCKLDFWPSRKKWMYKGKVQRGNVYGFIKSREKVS